jgi:hypothetical protein
VHRRQEDVPRLRREQVRRAIDLQGPEGLLSGRDHHSDGDKVHCDQSIGEIGDPCEGDTAACSEDGKKMLGCKADKRALLRTCPRGCKVLADQHKVVCQ